MILKFQLDAEIVASQADDLCLEIIEEIRGLGYAITEYWVDDDDE